MFAKGYKIASPAAALVIICFFLPWIMVSCSGQPVAEFSGWDLAVGPEINVGLGADRADPAPDVFLIPLLAIVVLGLAVRNYQRQSLSNIDTYGLLVLGLVPMIVMWIRFASAQGNASANGFQMSTRLGWWGSIIGLLGIAVGGLLNWQQMQQGTSLARAPSLPGAGPDHASRREPMLPALQVETPIEAAKSGVLATLHVSGGSLRGQTFLIRHDNVLLGRSIDCDIRLPDPTVSRHHARLRMAQGQWFIQDQQSSGGVKVNGQLMAAGRITFGDVIQLGDTELRFDAP